METWQGPVEQHGSALLAGNAMGLIGGLGVLPIVLARLHSSRPLAYLRLRKADIPSVAYAVVGLVAMLPFVLWTGTLNELLPLPEFIRNLGA